MVFSLSPVSYRSQSCSVLANNSWPFGFCSSKAQPVGAIAECSSVQEIWIPDAKGLMILGVYCDAMQPLYLS